MDSRSGSWTYSKYMTIIKVTSSALWLKSSLGDLPICFPITLFWKIRIMTSIVKVNCNWLFVRGIHRSPVNSPHKGQWRGALMFFIYARINGSVNNGEAGDLRRHYAHYDVIVIDMYVTAPFYKNALRSDCWNVLFLNIMYEFDGYEMY